MNGLIDVYEHYFNDLISFRFDLHKRKQHTCLVCTNNISDNGDYGVYSREATEKFIIHYLEHLKVFGYCIKLAEIFIRSVRDNGILSSNVKGYWRIKKHDVHEIVIIEHCTDPEKNEEFELNDSFIKKDLEE